MLLGGGDVLGDLGSNHLAGSAPRCEPVDKDDLVCSQRLLELSGAAERAED